MKRCELCRSRATSYCEADRAYLCWDCDAKVHGANFLVARHDRGLLCRACQSLTPWRASGSSWLGHASSLCHACSATDKTSRLPEDVVASTEVPLGGTALGPPPPPHSEDDTSSSSSSSSSTSSCPCASSAGGGKGCARGIRSKRCRLGSSCPPYLTCSPRRVGNNESSTHGLKPSTGERVHEEREAARNIDSSLKRRKKNRHPADRTD